MANLEIRKARLELSRQSLEDMINGRKFQIRDKLASASRRNKDTGLEQSLLASYSCFSVIDVAWNWLVQTGILERSSPEAAIFSSYLGADYGLSLLGAGDSGRTKIGERNCFTNESADFTRMYPLFLEGLLGSYSRALDTQSGIGLELLTGQYLSWIKDRALSEAERLPGFHESVSGIKGNICGSYDFSGMMRRSYRTGTEEESEFIWENFGGYKEEVDYFRDLALIIDRWDYCLSLGLLKKGELLPKGILLAGPPGTGKTRLARTFCNESGVPFDMIGVSDVGSSFVYETANNVQRKFDSAASYIRNKESPVSVLMIDELDSLGKARGDGSGSGREDDKVVTTIAQNMDGPKNVDGVLVIGTTNLPEAIDSCLTRGKRFEKTLYLGPLNRKYAEDIFSKYLGNCPGVDIGRIARDYVAEPARSARQTVEREAAAREICWTGAMIASLSSAVKREKLIRHLKTGADYHLSTGDVIDEIKRLYA